MLTQLFIVGQVNYSPLSILMKQYAQVVSQISLTLNTLKVAVGLIVRYMNLTAKASRHSEQGD